jgi:hypothetical protein
MFIGEFLCVLPLLWNWFATARKGRSSYLDRLLKRSPGYGAIPQDDEEEAEELDIDHIPMRGWAVCWMWFPAFFDSESTLEDRVCRVCASCRSAECRCVHRHISRALPPP